MDWGSRGKKKRGQEGKKEGDGSSCPVSSRGYHLDKFQSSFSKSQTHCVSQNEKNDP